MIPLAIVAPAAYVGINSFRTYGLNESGLDHLVANTVGYQPSSGQFNVNWAKGFWMGEIAGIIVHKVATRTGVNRQIKKLTMGYLGL
jgi:hypothetical protein